MSFSFVANDATLNASLSSRVVRPANILIQMKCSSEHSHLSRIAGAARRQRVDVSYGLYFIRGGPFAAPLQMAGVEDSIYAHHLFIVIAPSVYNCEWL